jgi:hypothetical protein
MRLSLLALLILCSSAISAASSVERLSWSQLPSIAGKHVRIVMPDSAVVSGRVIAVEPEALVVDVRESASPAVYPKGQLRVPRATLRTFEMHKKGVRYRIIGTVLGAAGGLVGGAVAGFSTGGGVLSNQHDARAAAVFLSIAAGGTAAGYLLGNAADRRTVTVVVEP